MQEEEKPSGDELAESLFDVGNKTRAEATSVPDFATLHSLQLHVFHDTTGKVVVVGDATSTRAGIVTITGSDGVNHNITISTLALSDQMFIVSEHDRSPLRSTSSVESKDSYRVWKSMDGKYTVEAKALSVDGDTVRLKLKGPEVKAVNVAKLSLEDSGYLRAAIDTLSAAAKSGKTAKASR